MKIDKPNYTQIPNALLDTMHERTPAENLIALAVARKTFGWHKEEDMISLTQFEKITGLSREGVKKCLKNLMDSGIITRRKMGNSFAYSINVVGNSVAQTGQLSSTDYDTQLPENQKNGQLSSHTKESIKENLKKNKESEISDGNKPNSVSDLESYILGRLKFSLRHEERPPARSTAVDIATDMVDYYGKWDSECWYFSKKTAAGYVRGEKVKSWHGCVRTFVKSRIQKNNVEFESGFTGVNWDEFDQKNGNG